MVDLLTLTQSDASEGQESKEREDSELRVGALPRQTPVEFTACIVFLGVISNRSQKTMLTVLALASVVLLGIAPEPSQAISIYTSWEHHALVGSDIRLSCTFFSWHFVSEDVSFTWTYRADGSRNSISVMLPFTFTHMLHNIQSCQCTGLVGGKKNMHITLKKNSLNF
ncbi:hypothetical protein CHARACLAT_007784 [Characodon lateralis]|uniref:Uncharacterized protein n=1 Tax=Characodon lateralis TaxID=208331 RepID=A0ABU7CVT1_9TELE|nr:hypothetical protein [Characodon lateralis]